VDNKLQQQKYSYSRPSAYFRGRALLKSTVRFNEGIQGFKLNKVQTANHAEKVWSTEGTFDQIHVWSLNNKSRIKHEQSINNWFKLSAAIHGDPVQTIAVKDRKDDVTESKDSEELKIESPSNESNDTTSSPEESSKSEGDSKPTTTTTTTPKAVPEDIQNTVNSMSFTDWNDNELKVTSIRFLEEHRLKIYGAKSESIRTAQYVLSVECIPDDDEDSDCDDDDDDDEDQELTETIVVINDEGKGIVIQMEDKIMMDDVSPSALVEYTFDTERGEWMLAPMGLMSLEGYRRSKFQNWKHMIEHPVCEAAFKRLLNIGLITNMFDHVAFPSPEHEEKEWIVKDEHDRDVVIPRPVKALRIWNVKNRGYDTVRAHLDGAPKEEEAEAYWEEMVRKFKEERGEEYIDSLLSAFGKNGGGKQ